MESGGVYFGISVFSFDELREATNNFDEARKFGEGGPEPTSKVVGRIEGLVAGTSQREFILVVLNFVFTEGNYNGSTITVLGRNRITQNIREIPVIGGTGVFRFATGYAETNTIFLDPKMRSTIEYNIFKNPKLYK
ncbi:dirigent protein 22 [Vigna angularis]|nr:dirigent protein 22 [Vigna angularis]